jgi:hypothetical protein
MNTAADEEGAWIIEERRRVAAYFDQRGYPHGTIGEYPAWHVFPVIAVWAVESLSAPGSVGWWAISGDLPVDYCSRGDPAEPRFAVRTIAERWLAEIDATTPGAQTIGETELSIDLAPALRKRANLLLEFSCDETLWD